MQDADNDNSETPTAEGTEPPRKILSPAARRALAEAEERQAAAAEAIRAEERRLAEARDMSRLSARHLADARDALVAAERASGDLIRRRDVVSEA
ncbi:hypothetical protein ACC771_16045, partial [Rhizobium ruizarguesonis]